MRWLSLVERFSTRRTLIHGPGEEALVMDDRSVLRPADVVEQKLTALLKCSKDRRPTVGTKRR